MKYGVYATGGSIGSNNKEPWKVFDSPEEAKQYAASMRKLLSKGERQYYKMGYSVRPIKESSDFWILNELDFVTENGKRDYLKFLKVLKNYDLDFELLDHNFDENWFIVSVSGPKGALQKWCVENYDEDPEFFNTYARPLDNQVIESNKTKYTKEIIMKKLTEKDLNLLEALMAKEAKFKKVNKVLPLKERVVLKKLKDALKRQFENSDDGFGDTFPNDHGEGEGFEAAIDPEGKTTDLPKGVNGLGEKAKSKVNADKIKAIKEKILAAKKAKMKEDEFGDELVSDDLDADLGDDFEGDGDADDSAAVIGQAFIDLVNDVQFGGDEELGDDEFGDDEFGGEAFENEDEILESVRQRAKSRREKLAKLRKNVMNEDDTPPNMTDKTFKDFIGAVGEDIGENNDSITHSESVKARVDAIKEKLQKARAKREAEVKTFGNGKLKVDAEDLATENVPDFTQTAYPGKKQNTGAAKHKKGLTEKLNFNDLISRGLLG